MGKLGKDGENRKKVIGANSCEFSLANKFTATQPNPAGGLPFLDIP
jgi:hypothetical protein